MASKSNAKYRVAVIGAGWMGGLIDALSPMPHYRYPCDHASAYAAIEDTEAVAVANRGEERRTAFMQRFGVARGYADYRELIEKERPDIVSIATPAYSHAEQIIFAAEHGVRGIYAEKGLCASLEEADRIAKALRANDVAFNWGTERRYQDGPVRVREAIERGNIGEPRFAVCYALTDLMKHHSHSFDTIAMLLGDPAPAWVEGRLIEPGDPQDPGDHRMGPREGTGPLQQWPWGLPSYGDDGHRFVPAPGHYDVADPYVGFVRVGYSNGAEAMLVPMADRYIDIDIQGTEGSAFLWDAGETYRVRRALRGGTAVSEQTIRQSGESPTVRIIREIVRQIETGERTSGNIDVTMQTVEVQFAVAHSHLNGGARVSVPVADRSLYIPSH